MGFDVHPVTERPGAEVTVSTGSQAAGGGLVRMDGASSSDLDMFSVRGVEPARPSGVLAWMQVLQSARLTVDLNVEIVVVRDPLLHPVGWRGERRQELRSAECAHVLPAIQLLSGIVEHVERVSDVAGSLGMLRGDAERFRRLALRRRSRCWTRASRDRRSASPSPASVIRRVFNEAWRTQAGYAYDRPMSTAHVKTSNAPATPR